MKALVNKVVHNHILAVGVEVQHGRNPLVNGISELLAPAPTGSAGFIYRRDYNQGMITNSLCRY